MSFWQDVRTSFKETLWDYTSLDFWLYRLSVCFYIRRMVQLGIGPIFLTFLGASCCKQTCMSVGYGTYLLRFMMCMIVFCTIPEILVFPGRVARRVWLKQYLRALLKHSGKRATVAA
jgi:hypothetical protein